MKRSSRMMVTVWVLAMAVVVSPACFAAEQTAQVAPTDKVGQESEKGAKGAVKEDMLKDLNLTPEQREQLKAHREANRQAMNALRDELKAKRAELRQEISRAETDMAKLEQIKAAMKDLSGRQVDQRIDSVLSLKKILTPEQFQKMNAKMEEGHTWRGRKPGGRSDKEAPPPRDEE